jgi:GAF domain-containing protein
MATREREAGLPVARAEAQAERTVESRYLYQIINTVSSTLELDRVLRAIVDLVTEATGCRACFVYFVDPADDSLVLRAVSSPFEGLVGRLRFEAGEGLAGWVASNRQPVFLEDNALADPRVKAVPEAEEEKYQSLVAVPLTAKSGQVIGVIALQSKAPREFTADDCDFVINAARLVAGAIENARLYHDTRRRLALVEGLSDLARAVSAASTPAELLPAVARRARRILGASAAQLLLAAPAGARLTVGASSPADAPAPREVDATALGVELAVGGRRPDRDAARRLAALVWGAADAIAIVVPMVAADELVGFLALRFERGRRLHADEREIAASIASQAAVAIKKVQLIDRLTARNATKDLLADLAGAAAGEAALRERATALGADLSASHLALVAAARPAASAPPASWEAAAELFERAVLRAFPGSLLDRREAAVRGLVRLGDGGEVAAVARLREIHASVRTRHPLAVGLSNACAGVAGLRTGLDEADLALAAGGVVGADAGVVAFDDLGAYKYLLRVAKEGRVRDRRGEALARLGEYDRRHRSQLLHTLEEYLKRRGNIAAAATALYVHPNTLRQRLRRIQDLTGLDVAREDWLMIEIELKLLRLQQALGRDAA